jgi:hypothetical protein
MSKGGKREEIDQFLADFTQQKESLLGKLAAIELDGMERPQELFDGLIKDYNVIKKMFNDASSILPPYNLKQSQIGLNEMWSELEAKRDKIIPRKKFAFKKQQPKDVKIVDVVDTAVKELNIDHETVTEQEKPICERLDEDITLSRDEVDGQDLHFSNLTRCHVRAIGSPNNVYLKNLKDCTVDIGPAKTSVFIDQCIRCTFNVCSQQLRIHSTTKCTFFVLATSKPIIEDCGSLRFDRYKLQYDEITADYESASIHPDTCFYNQVIDFNWLSTDKPSPNWSENKLYANSSF